MSKRIVISISREYGSGGREVGRIIAEKLGIPFYDKELMTYLAQKSGIDEELFKQINDKIGFANFYFGNKEMRLGRGALGDLGTLGLHERIQRVQEELIKKLSQESCVIIGRCSDYILKDDPNTIKVFIRANLMDKKRRAVGEYGEKVETVNEKLLDVDTRRANYYNYFTDQVWGKASHYDIMLSTSHISLEEAAEVIRHYAETRKNNL